MKFMTAEFDSRPAAGSGAELVGHSKPWDGCVARLEASVGPAPTARTQPVYELMVAAFGKFESAASASGHDPNALKEAAELLKQADGKLDALTAEITQARRRTRFPFPPPSGKDVRFGSAALFVRRLLASKGSAQQGVLLLTDDRLIFVPADPAASWQVARSDVVRAKRPWYGMGSYLRLDVKGANYRLAFGRGRDFFASQSNLARLSSVSGVTIRSGLAGGRAGQAEDAVVITSLDNGSALAGKWVLLLSQRSSP